jgi:Zn-dependent M28 family amino/carboxypeptidase
VNLEAKRGTPRIWLVAHLDSKSQPIPILVRAAAIVACVTLWVALVAMAALQVKAGWPLMTLAAVLAGLPVAISTIGSASPGALDNATGVAAVLLAAQRVDRSVPLGVLITSAEELGLAGSRAWVRAQPSKAPVINCDTIDDHGYLTIMHSHGRPERLIRAFERRAVRARRVLPGILVDSVAFAEAGWDAVTVSRGTLATLARIHRPTDTPAGLRGRGVAEAADIIAEALLDV